MARHTDEDDVMFSRECDMSGPVARWMKSRGLTVKSEFVMPWGICDLVGLSLRSDKVDDRCRLGQTRAIGSITAAALLLQIPDVREKKSTTVGRLVRHFSPSVPEKVVSEQIGRLIADGFVKPRSSGRLQKENGWHPLQDDLVAVELKLSRIGEAMHQALNNLGFAQESYVGLPAEVARRVASSASRWLHFFDAGVGLLGVTRRSCEVLLEADPLKAQDRTEEAVRFYCVEKFWRTRVKGN